MVAENVFLRALFVRKVNISMIPGHDILMWPFQSPPSARLAMRTRETHIIKTSDTVSLGAESWQEKAPGSWLYLVRLACFLFWTHTPQWRERCGSSAHSSSGATCAPGDQDPAPHLVVTRARWLAEPSAVSIQDAPRRTRMSWSAAWYCDAVHSHTLPTRS